MLKSWKKEIHMRLSSVAYQRSK
uniref:Uncharacterized protein n=1 Tax=Arundo donax TaxID=35708 RepID=A0A0A9E437_ARUDO